MTAAAAEEATRAAAAAGLHEILLPNPFHPGGVSCWLVEDDPLTLVDAGANWCTSILALEDALAARGHRLEDLERVVLTHHHCDHAGALEMIVARSRAEVVALASLAPWLADQPEQEKLDDRYRLQVLERHGAPAAVCRALQSANRVENAWGCAAEVTCAVRDGDDLVFADRTWRVLTRPGHSYGDTVFVDRDRRLAIAGDHLLPDFPSVPFIVRPPDPHASGDVPRQLIVYRESLAQTRALDLDVVLPGHGRAFSDHRALIDRREQACESLLAKISALLSRGPSTAYGVSTALWERHTLLRPEAMMSTVLGYLGILLEAGAVTANLEADVFRFELS